MANVKIYGPYRHGDGYRCYLRTDKGAARVWCPTGTTEQEARDLAEIEVEDWRRKIGRTIGDLCEDYLAYLLADGRKDISVDSAAVKLRLLLGEYFELGVEVVTDKWAKAQYMRVATSGTCAARSQHEALMRATACWRWAMDHGILSANPWARVRPMGKERKGKEQLTIDEGRALMAVCLDHAAECDGALAILIAQLCGLRSMEILTRVVRDVDGNGTILRVIDAKTPAGTRPVDLPEEIQGFVRQRVTGRGSHALLLSQVEANVNRSGWLHRKLTRYCQMAGVPEICPHALRGQWATIAYQAGALSHLVARALGHTSAAITERHYATAESVAGAKQAQRLTILKGGRG